MTHSTSIPLAADPIDRAAHYRLDPVWLDEALTRPNVLIFLMQEGKPLITGGRTDIALRPGDQPAVPSAPLIWFGPEVLALGPRLGQTFLGLDKAGTPVFALDMTAEFRLADTPWAGLGDFEDMRAAAARLPALEANLAATARSLFLWHAQSGYCARCGQASVPAEAGWKRLCLACGAEHFPRTDPVAIMLAVSGDKCLLGRQAAWPQGFWSCLAGFVEVGETFEQAAAREVFEEAGIRADPTRVEYLFCQPWPFASSLMLGVIVQADYAEPNVGQDELEAARWFTRAEVRYILAGQCPGIYAPPPLAIAHHILKVWAAR